jgi:nitrogen fixation/metabolism regulation signal transduction histidine kinase
MRQGRAPDTGLITILLIYIVLVVLIIVFANQILVDITRESPLSNFIILPIAILLPLLLLGAIILNLARVFKEKRQGKPGVLFKIRLIIFFSFISLLSSIPQGILSLTFVDTAMSSWFSSRLRQGLQGGFEIALQYHRDKISLLEAVGESPLLQRAFSEDRKSVV